MASYDMLQKDDSMSMKQRLVLSSNDEGDSCLLNTDQNAEERRLLAPWYLDGSINGFSKTKDETIKITNLMGTKTTTTGDGASQMCYTMDDGTVSEGYRRWDSLPPVLHYGTVDNTDVSQRTKSCDCYQSNRCSPRNESLQNFEVWPESPTEYKVFAVVVGIKIALMSLVAFAVILCLTHLEQFELCLRSFLRWVSIATPWSLFVFVAIFAVATTLFLPGEILVLSAGYVFCDAKLYGPIGGILIALLVCFCGQLSSAVLCYSIAQRILYKPLRLVFKKFKLYNALMLAAEDGGAWFVILCRLSPIVPFALTNYCFGCTSISIPSLLIGHLGGLPFLAVVVFIGSQISDVNSLMHDPSTLTVGRKGVILYVSGIGIAVLAVAFAIWLTMKKLKEIQNVVTRFDVNSSTDRVF